LKELIIVSKHATCPFQPSGITEKGALVWNPQGKSRPKKTWKRTVEEETRDQEKRWQEVKVLAKNKVRWRSFV
jgi:hypothetical protein